MTLQPSNLLWQKRFRGLVPFVANSVSDDGHALIIRPDELEARTYQVVDTSPSGDGREVCALSVETVHKFEVVPSGEVLLGVTVDDVYVFREGKKSRFMPDRRVTYSDVALARCGRLLACAFSDMMFASHTVALGDTGGRVAWTKDMDAPVARVAITPDGRAIVCGSSDGRIIALDHLRSTLWENLQQEPVTGLAIAADGSRCAVGTEAGSILAVDAEGAVSWSATAGLPVLAVATEGAGEWVAAVAGDSTGSILSCYGPGGTVIWELDLEGQPTGLAFSPNGRFLGISMVDGTALLFETDFSATVGMGGSREAAMEEVAALEAAGDLRGARDRLLRILKESPGYVVGGERLAGVEDAYVAARTAEAESRCSAGDFAGALAALDAAQAVLPADEPLFRERAAVRQQAIEAFRREAARAAGEGRLPEASESLRGLLALNSRDDAARAQFADIQGRVAEGLAAEGDDLAARSDVAGALERWRQALALHEDPDLELRIRNGEVRRCVEAGMALYQQQRYPEAAFQFRKALALDPNHEEARRYLGYTQGAGGDTAISGRFGRLE